MTDPDLKMLLARLNYFSSTVPLDQALIQYQIDHALAPDGKIGPKTLRSLLVAQQMIPHLPAFRGAIEWIHEQEAHQGAPYWPGGRSGVTLDPGVDLGYASTVLIEDLFKPLVTEDQWVALTQVFGKKGAPAKAALTASPVLNSIRLSRAQAEVLFPQALKPYWSAISNRFREITYISTPPPVQTVLLSLAYNRGPHNQELAVLKSPIARRDWASLAQFVQTMQQDHTHAGIRTRRRLEASWITRWLTAMRQAP